MVGIKDFVKDSVPEAIDKCREAGVRVRMVTGHTKEAAVVAAKDAGILPF
jgi:P-type Ca2+ transporter type 2C